MKFIAPTDENAMVLEFLKAEINSPRFGVLINDYLSENNLSREIIEKANLNSTEENEIRSRILDYRGYRTRTWLFFGFPKDVTWSICELSREDFKHLYYTNFKTWVDLSGGSRKVLDGAENVQKITVAENANENIKMVAQRMKNGECFPMVIAVKNDEKFVLLEGHTRSTAHLFLNPDKKMDIMLGESKNMKNWALI